LSARSARSIRDFASVVTEIKFAEIAMEVVLSYVVVHPDNSTLQDRKVSLVRHYVRNWRDVFTASPVVFDCFFAAPVCPPKVV